MQILKFLIYSLIVLISACNTEEDDPPCGTNISRFAGAWNIAENCGGNEKDYILTISTNSSGGITLVNLGNLGQSARLETVINGSSSFIIQTQDIQGYTITGNGSLNGGCSELVISWAGSPSGICLCSGSK